MQPTVGSDSASIHPAYRPDIDGLRAIAVISVVIYHAFPSALRGGFIGVDIFFVISGFLISSIIFKGLETDRFSFVDFYARRVKRIFPSLAIMLIACLVLGWHLLLANEYQQLGRQVAAGAAFVSNFALWSDSGYFDTAASQKPLLHLWSLGIEEQFYFFWPLLSWLIYRRHRSFFALTLTIAVTSFVVNVATVELHPVAAFYSPLSRFWELMIGGILAFITLHKPQYLHGYPNSAAIAGVVMIGFGLLLLNSDSEFPGWWALLPAVGAFLILAAGQGALFNRAVLGNRVMVSIGLISYPLYLWHWPALFLGTLVTPFSSRITRLAAVAISVVLASLTYWLVEKPLRQAKSLRRVSGWLMAAMATCALFGLLAYFLDGFDFRLPKQFAPFTRSTPDELHTTCFLKDRDDFDPKCTTVLRRPAIFIWGDSHADRLYWGLKPLADRGEVSILQITGASCPPLLHTKSNGNRSCESINDYAFESIRRTSPDVIVLHASWAADTVDLSKIDATVKELRRAGAKSIVLLGPVPKWNGTLLRSLFRCWHPTSDSDLFPEFSDCGLDPQVTKVDATLRERAERLQIKYISAIAALCNKQGCLTHVQNDGVDQLESYDYGHLSEGASKYLISSIREDLLPEGADSGLVVGRRGS